MKYSKSNKQGGKMKEKKWIHKIEGKESVNQIANAIMLDWIVNAMDYGTETLEALDVHITEEKKKEIVEKLQKKGIMLAKKLGYEIH